MLFEKSWSSDDGTERWVNTGSGNNYPDEKKYEPGTDNVIATRYGDKWYDEHGKEIY